MSEASFYQLTATSIADDGAVAETFDSTSHTAGPWGPGMQHGGPVAGLLTRAMERVAVRPNTRISRICVDLLGAVSLGPVRVSARVARPGRRIELLTARLETPSPNGGWRTAALASGWRLATQPTSEVRRHSATALGDPPADNDQLESFGLLGRWRSGGFANALTIKMVRQGGATPGHSSAAWMRLNYPLVAGETTSDLVRLMTIADGANGIGARLDPQEYSFLNTDLTVQIYEEPIGPWFGLEAESSIGSDGIGMGDAVLHGASGPIGRVTQNLLVERHAAG